jgi:hypothetical protein
MNALKPLLLTSALLALPMGLAAQSPMTVTVPATQQHVVTQGNWHRSTVDAEADGVRAETGTMVLLPTNVAPGDSDPLSLSTASLLAGSGLRGSIEIPLQITTGDMPHSFALVYPPRSSSVRDLLVTVRHGGGFQETRLTLLATSGNTWVPLFSFESMAPGDATLRIVADEGTAAPDPFSPAVFSLSAIQMTTGQSGPATAPFVIDDLPMPEVDDPFLAPPEVDDPFAEPDVADDPFEVPVVDDPFAIPMVEDPFGVTALEDPFADPFGDPSTVAATPAPTEAPVDSAPEDPFAMGVSQPAPVVLATPTPAPTPAPTPRMMPLPTPDVVKLADLSYHPSLDAARQAARESGRRILIVFTGETRRAQEFDEAFRHPEVAAILGDFELVSIDYRTNRELARQFAVRDFPYVVVVNSMGYTEDHLLVSGNRAVLLDRLRPYTQSFFR